MSVSQAEPAPSPTPLPERPSQAAPVAAARLAGWRPRLERAVIGLVAIVAGLENVLVWIDPRSGAERGKDGFNSRRVWAHLLRAARWLQAMQARLAEEGRAERAARRAEKERLGERGTRGGRKPGAKRKPRRPAEKPEADDCIAGRSDQQVMAQILADLAVVARMLEDDDAARRLAIYQREVQALLGGPPSGLVAAAEAERRMVGRGRAKAASGERERPQQESAGADQAAAAMSAPDSG